RLPERIVINRIMVQGLFHAAVNRQVSLLVPANTSLRQPVLSTDTLLIDRGWGFTLPAYHGSARKQRVHGRISGKLHRFLSLTAPNPGSCQRTTPAEGKRKQQLRT